MTAAVATADLPVALYRLFDESGTLLYVGITGSPAARMNAHRHDKPWWSEVDPSRTTWAWHDNRDQAAKAEVETIRGERPRYNVMSSLTAEQEVLLRAAVCACEKAAEAERRAWKAVEAARWSGVPDPLLCEQSGVSRATLNRKLGPRKAKDA